MKNQYVGDINDYRKYGLLRILQEQIGGPLLVAWMLTKNDSSSDGAFRSYLQDPERWRRNDPELYDELRKLRSSAQPDVSHIEASGVLPGARFYSDMVPDSRDGRGRWTRQLLERARGAELVFVDPDNGFEIPSKPVGRKDSSKYVTREEIQSLWDLGCSVLIYQHFRREKRDSFVQRMLLELSEIASGGSVVGVGFRTPHVLFLLAGQRHHQQAIELINSRLLETWNGEIVLNRPANPTIPDARAMHGAGRAMNAARIQELIEQLRRNSFVDQIRTELKYDAQQLEELKSILLELSEEVQSAQTIPRELAMYLYYIPQLVRNSFLSLSGQQSELGMRLEDAWVDLDALVGKSLGEGPPNTR